MPGEELRGEILDPFVGEDALQQVAELTARQRLEDKRGKTRIFDLFAQLEIVVTGEGDHRDGAEGWGGADALLDGEGFTAGEVEVHQDEVGERLHLVNLLGDVCASRIPFEAYAQVAQK